MQVTVPRVVGWGTFAASCLLVLAGVSVHGVGGAEFGEDAVLAVAFTGLGALVLTREPHNRAGWVCLTPVLAAAAYAAQSVAGPDGGVVAWLAAWLWLPGLLPVLTVLLLVLPDGHLPGPRWRPLAWSVLAVIVVLTLGLAVAAAAAEPQPTGSTTDLLLVGLVLACGVACLSGLLTRLVRARTAERAQLLWITLGATVFVLGSSLPAGLPEPWRSAVAEASALALPAGAAVAVLRHRLFDLNPLLHRLVLGLVLGLLALGSFLALHAMLGGGTAAAAVVCVGLVLLAPAVSRWLGAGIGRVVYGGRGDPAADIAELGRRLSTSAEPRNALEILADAVGRAVPGCGVRAVLGSGEQVLASAGEGEIGAAPTHSVELRFGGARQGRVDVAAAGGLDDAERAMLDDLVGAAAAAMAAAHRSLELQRSRELLVVAREQERRRIARDLHDGVGPVLSGLGFTLDALRATLDDRPEQTRVAARAAGQVRDAAVLVRGLSRGLRPAGLDQLGLAGALTELAAHHTTARLAVHVDLPEPVPVVAAAAEVATYAIAAEAVTNVARHAGATCCRISVRLDGPDVVLTIRDDGVGLRGTGAGTGRTSMIERADELGGRCTIVDGAPRGTVVTAVLPDDAGAEP